MNEKAAFFLSGFCFCGFVVFGVGLLFACRVVLYCLKVCFDYFGGRSELRARGKTRAY